MGLRRAAALLVAICFAALLIPTASGAAESQEAGFVSAINAERASRGLNTLIVRSDLGAVARAWSQRMASEGRIWHDPNIETKVDGWTVLGDNVGRGGQTSAIHEAFMDSPAHRDVILDERFNEVGVGVVTVGNTIYVTEILVRRGSSAAPAPVRRRAPSRPLAPAARGEDVQRSLTERIWSVDLTGPSMTVDVLVRLLALDSMRVDPATGIPHAD